MKCWHPLLYRLLTPLRSLFCEVCGEQVEDERNDAVDTSPVGHAEKSAA